MPTIIPYTLDRHAEVLALMEATPGLAVREADSREATARYLERNPGLSFLVEAEGRIVGCAMSGHDGRRGYLQHVVVAPEYRGQGLAHALITRCLDGLEAQGILKVHLDVFADNDLANRYWTRRGWQRRDDLIRYSLIRGENENV